MPDPNSSLLLSALFRFEGKPSTKGELHCSSGRAHLLNRPLRNVPRGLHITPHPFKSLCYQTRYKIPILLDTRLFPLSQSSTFITAEFNPQMMCGKLATRKRD